jgi:CAAX prenyl protease-like protein
MSNATERYPGWVPYVVPYALFLAITALGNNIDGALYIAYPVRTVIVAAVVIWFWRQGDYPELELRPSLLGIVAGVVGFAFWVYPENLLSFLPKLGESTFDPDGAGESMRTPLLTVRMIGAVLVVPIFEELFLRSFLVRYFDIIKEDGDDFRDIPLGRYRFFSFAGVVIAMALTHHRWLRGGLYSALMLFVLYREKRMGPVIWAHAITNLLLGIHVIHTGEWVFW